MNDKGKMMKHWACPSYPADVKREPMVFPGQIGAAEYLAAQEDAGAVKTEDAADILGSVEE